MRISRRLLLKSAGLSPLAAPFLPVLEAPAQTNGFPKRLLLTFTPNGSIPEAYWPEGAETNFTLRPGSILEPLKGLESKLLIPKDLQRDWDPLAPNEHEKGIACMYTGATLNGGPEGAGNGFASGPSIDQIIANIINPDTRFKSLQIAAQSDGPSGGQNDTMRYLSYSGDNQPLPNENSPYALFDRLVSDQTGRSEEELAMIRERRQSVLDFVNAELTSLSTQLGTREADKVAAHVQAVRQIEMRLQRGGDALLACGGTTPEGEIDLQQNDNFPLILKLQTDLVVNALACDATRFVTLLPSKAYSMTRFPWIGIGNEHHTVSHDLTDLGNEQNIAINRWYMEQFAYLLSEMAKIPEGDGSLLDNTLVVCGAEQAHGGLHIPNPGVSVLAGSLGGTIRTGRFIDYQLSANWTQMLVTICHAMGATSVEQVGNLGPGGVIPGILADS
jgi:hypothetical protein